MYKKMNLYQGYILKWNIIDDNQDIFVKNNCIINNIDNLNNHTKLSLIDFYCYLN